LASQDGEGFEHSKTHGLAGDGNAHGMDDLPDADRFVPDKLCINRSTESAVKSPDSATDAGIEPANPGLEPV
jgi:hypothetical protein